MRIVGALALVVGLMLSSAGVALATPEPEESESPVEEAEGDLDESDEDLTDDESADDSSSEPSPTSTDSDSAPQEESPEGNDDDQTATPSPAASPEVEVDCSNASVEAGQVRRVTCSTGPSGATLTVNNDESQIGGSIAVEGNQLVYTAPADRTGTDDFTVAASADGFADGRTQVTFTVTASEASAPSPTPSVTPTRETPGEEDSPPPQSATTDEDTAADENPPSSETSIDPEATSVTPAPDRAPTSEEPIASALPPGAPHDDDVNVSSGALLLPVPGMPGLNGLAIPQASEYLGPELPSSSDAVDSGNDNSPGALARTGGESALSAAVLGGITVAVGAGIMLMSRRLKS